MADPADFPPVAPARTMETRWSAEASAHKLFAPPIYPGAIRRDGILDRIFNNASVRVILLQGPAGHGKSTTLQQIKSDNEAKDSGGSGSSDRNLSRISGKICQLIEPCEGFCVKSSSLIFCYRS